MSGYRKAIPTVAILLGSLLLTAAWAPAQTVPASKHVLIVFGENTSYSSSVGNMPYLDSLVAKYGLATNYVADTHPSIGNYLVWASGQILTNNDSYSGTFSDDNIAFDVEQAKLTWKDYVEDIDSSCPGLNSGGYAEKHDPLAYFSNINQSNRVCFDQFATDLKNNALPNLSYLGPNLCDDAHDCFLSTFDGWLQTVLPPLLASPYFQPGGDGILVVTFDEGSGSKSNTTSGIESGTWTGGQVETVIISPMAKSGYKSTNSYHHESVLRMMEEALGLTTFPGASLNPNGALTPPIDMSDFFTTSSGGGTVTLSPTSLNFGNVTQGTTSSAQSLTLTNGTSSSVTLGIGITGANAADFSQTNTCNGSLAGNNATCTISVTFTPSTTSSETATLNTGISGLAASLSGTGVSSSGGGGSPVASLSATRLNFGKVALNSTSTKTVTLTNTGGSSLSITRIAVSPTPPFTVSSTCGLSVAANGGNCVISVIFTPTTSGHQTGTLTVSDNSGGSATTQTVNLSGNAH